MEGVGLRRNDTDQPLIPILHTGKLRLREAEQFARCSIVGKSQGSSSELQTLTLCSKPASLHRWRLSSSLLPTIPRSLFRLLVTGRGLGTGTPGLPQVGFLALGGYAVSGGVAMHLLCFTEHQTPGLTLFLWVPCLAPGSWIWTFFSSWSSCLFCYYLGQEPQAP